MPEEEHEGASVQERLVGACRDDSVEILREIIDSCHGDEAKIADLMNNTKDKLGNHLYHVAAQYASSEVIDLLLDQPGFECDPINRMEGDTPLHSAVRWINAHPSVASANGFGDALVRMMLEAGSNPRARNRAKLTPGQLADPANTELRRIIQEAEYANMMSGDFVPADGGGKGDVKGGVKQTAQADVEEEDDDDAEFSGSDDEERAEWERQRKARRGR